MCKRILSACVSVQEGVPPAEFRFCHGINILFGQNAEDVVLTLAGVFGGVPPQSFHAALNWRDDATLFVSGYDGRVFVDSIENKQGDPAQLMKCFYKHRFLNFRKNAHLLDGSRLHAGTSGTGDLLLEKLNATLAKEDDCPLFICNFLERLDEAIDLQPIWEALLATRRQIFIAVPHYYNTKQLEEMHSDIHIL